MEGDLTHDPSTNGGPGLDEETAQQIIRETAERVCDTLDEIDDLRTNIKAAFDHAKRRGLNAAVLRKAVAAKRKRDKDREKFDEEDDLFDTYLRVILK